jgi:hypothetical protein
MPFAELDRTVLNQVLDPQQGMPYAMRAVVRSQLGMAAETSAPTAVSTNAPAISPAPDNASATNSSK